MTTTTTMVRRKMTMMTTMARAQRATGYDDNDKDKGGGRQPRGRW
jgi:hypothetical protein